MNLQEFELKCIYFVKFRKYFMLRKLKKLKNDVVILYANHHILKKSLLQLFAYAARSREVQKICSMLIKNRNFSLSDLMERTQLQPTLTKSIFVLHYHRIKTMRKYFNQLTLNTKLSRSN